MSDTIARLRLASGEIRLTSDALTLAVPGGGWLVGTARLRFVAVRRVRYVLWYLLGGLLACYCLIQIQMGTITALPGWGGLLLGGSLLAYGLRGGWHLMAHLHDAPEPLSAFVRPHDDLPNGEAALGAFEDDVNEYLRAQAEARRLAAEAEAPSAPPLPAGLGWTVTTASTPPGGATFTPRPPNPYPPSLLPGILP